MEMLLKLDLLAKEEDEEQREQENRHSIESKSDDIGQNNNAKKAKNRNLELSYRYLITHVEQL